MHRIIIGFTTIVMAGCAIIAPEPDVFGSYEWEEWCSSNNYLNNRNTGCLRFSPLIRDYMDCCISGNTITTTHDAHRPNKGWTISMCADAGGCTLSFKSGLRAYCTCEPYETYRCSDKCVVPAPYASNNKIRDALIGHVGIDHESYYAMDKDEYSEKAYQYYNGDIIEILRHTACRYKGATVAYEGVWIRKSTNIKKNGVKKKMYKIHCGAKDDYRACSMDPGEYDCEVLLASPSSQYWIAPDKAFTGEHPDEKHNHSTAENIEAIEWEKAVAIDTQEAYQAFLKHYPESAHTDELSQNMAEPANKQAGDLKQQRCADKTLQRTYPDWLRDIKPGEEQRGSRTYMGGRDVQLGGYEFISDEPIGIEFRGRKNLVLLKGKGVIVSPDGNRVLVGYDCQ